MGLNPHPDLVCRGPRKSRAIPLPTLRTFVAYRKGENLPTCIYARRKGLVRYSDDAHLGASVAHSPKKVPSIVVRFSLNLRHHSSYQFNLYRAFHNVLRDYKNLL